MRVSAKATRELSRYFLQRVKCVIEVHFFSVSGMRYGERASSRTSYHTSRLGAVEDVQLPP